MKTLGIRVARIRLSQLVDEVAAGEEIVITKYGKPLARLLPLARCHEPRIPGLLKGKIWIAEDFDEPLPQEIMDHFGGEPR